LAVSMSKALEKTTLRTETTGVVNVKKGQVALKPNQTIGIDPNATVGIDPNASVRVKGGITVTIPAWENSGRVSQIPDKGGPGHRSKLLTNYNVFKQVNFGSGFVITGWEYASNEQTVPSRQFCYYAEKLDETSEGNISLGQNGQMDSQQRQRNIDVAGAFQNCVWFGGAH
jgi:hypothetical protein